MLCVSEAFFLSLQRRQYIKALLLSFVLETDTSYTIYCILYGSLLYSTVLYLEYHGTLPIVEGRKEVLKRNETNQSPIVLCYIVG